MRHERRSADLFSEVLRLCAKAGLVKVGLVAVDGSKIAAAATHHQTRSYEQIAQEILKEAGETDAAEDELFGEARGDELPEGSARGSGARGCATRSSRSRLSGPRRRRRFRASATSGCGSAASASSRTTSSSGA